jgi:cytochrome c556
MRTERTIATMSAAALAALVLTGLVSRADDHQKLPPGPITDRHELMEGVGEDAEDIGDALKAGKPADTAAPAQRIAGAADRFLTLFPPGSEDPNSRAKPEIWTKRTEFDKLGGELKTAANDLAEAAKSGGDVKKASGNLFKACKGCHTQFRKPKDDED